MKLTLALATIAAASAADKVKVTLYEESLCPACVGYFDAGTDLQPVNSGFWVMYENLKDIVDAEVVMWGNAVGDPSQGADAVTCQHGEVECRGNLLFGCAKNLYPDVNAQLSLIHCFDSALIVAFPAGLPSGAVNMTMMDDTVKACTTESDVNMDYDKLDECASGDDGLAYLSAEKDKTPGHSGVPFTVINDGDVVCPPPDDLTAAVCEAYTGLKKPEACTAALRNQEESWTSKVSLY
ncbi:hypothetical protein TrVE_jg11943 [Triparma verrucosa]|uniref:Gamma-interferon-inducible lysosomal thiol reductase n=1 Tax=Triparma verrucosa TaxID=1606542 RepID=A0A9W7F1I8_9STRA|nr:hypothetical protein TrVE_jg11943 [Triparma verrucosa]